MRHGAPNLFEYKDKGRRSALLGVRAEGAEVMTHGEGAG